MKPEMTFLRSGSAVFLLSPFLTQTEILSLSLHQQVHHARKGILLGTHFICLISYHILDLMREDHSGTDEPVS